MPRVTKKKETRRKHTPEKVSNTPDVQMLLVIALLVCVYPIGVIMMWLWMTQWPRSLKVVISIPAILGILALLAGLLFISLVIRQYRQDWRTERMRNQYYYRQHQKFDNNNSMPTSPTPILLPSTDTTY